MSIPPETQLAWFTTALEELPAFLPSSDAFRPLHHPPPRMVHDLSLGTMMLTIDSLTAKADELTPAESAAWNRAQLRWEAVASSHAAAIEAKARAEVPHRLNLWRSFLQDLVEKASETERYASEVRHRVIIERLLPIAGADAGEDIVASLRSSDTHLRAHSVPAAFIWEAVLSAVYPADTFWFLYRLPVTKAG